MDSLALVVGLLGVVCVYSCAHHNSQPSHDLRVRLADTRLSPLRSYAPHLFASAEAALARAKAAEEEGHWGEASDHSAYGIWMLANASAEAKRIILLRRLRSVEAQGYRIESARDAYERTRISLERELQRLTAEHTVKSELARLRKLDQKKNPKANKDNFRILYERAMAQLLTAEHLGAPSEAVNSAKALLEKAKKSRSDEELVSALEATTEVMANVWMSQANPYIGEGLSLVEEAKTWQLHAELTAEGVGLSWTVNQMTDETPKQFAVLLKAYPRGVVRFACSPDPLASPPSESTGVSRPTESCNPTALTQLARRVIQSDSALGERIQVDRTAHKQPTPFFNLVFLAYTQARTGH